MFKIWNRAYSPLDNPQSSSANNIFKADIDSINKSDIIIANFNPYAGMLVDDETAFECGYGYATGKKYMAILKMIDFMKRK